MKNKYLVVDDYGQGGLWAFVWADSPDEIAEKFPELKVIRDVPAWMTDSIRSEIEATRTYNLDEPATGLLAAIIRGRSRGS